MFFIFWEQPELPLTWTRLVFRVLSMQGNKQNEGVSVVGSEPQVPKCFSPTVECLFTQIVEEPWREPTWKGIPTAAKHPSRGIGFTFHHHRFTALRDVGF